MRTQYLDCVVMNLLITFLAFGSKQNWISELSPWQVVPPWLTIVRSCKRLWNIVCCLFICKIIV